MSTTSPSRPERASTLGTCSFGILKTAIMRPSSISSPLHLYFLFFKIQGSSGCHFPFAMQLESCVFSRFCGASDDCFHHASIPSSSHIGLTILTAISVTGSLLKLKFGTLDGLWSAGSSLKLASCAGSIWLEGCMLMIVTVRRWASFCFVLAFRTVMLLNVVTGLVRTALLLT